MLAPRRGGSLSPWRVLFLSLLGGGLIIGLAMLAYTPT